MKHSLYAFVSTLPLLALGACGDAPSALEPVSDTPAPAPTAAPTPGPAGPAGFGGTDPVAAAAAAGFAAKVNGFEISEATVKEEIHQVIAAQTQGRMLPPQTMLQAETSLRPQVIANLIDDRLLDEDAERAGVEATTEEVLAEIEREIDAMVLLQGVTREDIAERVANGEGTNLEDFLALQAEDPRLRRTARHTKLLTGAYPEESAISAEEIESSYQTDLEQVFTRPVMVRASHILIGTEQAVAPEQRDEAKKKAEEVLELCKAEGADFAALAGEHSTGPSAPNGGDLGFFPREGAMVEPFAAAAFELEVDGLSGVVETQFGYHVIQCTARQEARVITVEEASDVIRGRLSRQKVADLRAKHVEKLRADAEIEAPGA
jgi:peptidyl-prolyl cis-trans isomerase C